MLQTISLWSLVQSSALLIILLQLRFNYLCLIGTRMSISKADPSFFITPLPTIRSPGASPSERGISILQAMNDDVRELNRLIDLYNRADDFITRINILKQLDQRQQYLDDAYPDDIIAMVPDYQLHMYTSLHQAICRQREQLHVDSNYQLLAIYEPDLGRELSNVIQGMSTADIAQLMQVLASGVRKNLRARLASIAPTNRAYQDFLIQHDIMFIGGGNSVNFAFVDRISQQRIILKLENRLNIPKRAERELRDAQQNSSSFLIREWSDRRAVFDDPKTNKKTVRRLIVVDYTQARILEDIPTQSDIIAQQMQAVDIALAQILLYKKMHNLGKTWTDGKGSNIFFHRDPRTVCMVAEVADCKAFYPCDPINRTAYFSGSPIVTVGVSAPELMCQTPGTVNIEQLTVYAIGKNLYESLLVFVPSAYQKYFAPDQNDKRLSDAVELTNNYFKHPIFAEPFQSLIQHMTCADPAARMSNDDLFTQLLDIKFAAHPQREQYQQICQKLKVISGFTLDDENQQKKNEFLLRCYEDILLPQADLLAIDQRLSRVIQKYATIAPSTIYKEALSAQRKDESHLDHTKGLGE